MKDAKTLAQEWIEIWSRGEPEKLPLAEHFVHVSPFGRLEGRGRYLEVVEPMAAHNVPSLDIERVLGEGDQACIAFVMNTPNGPIPGCDWITAEDGLITSIHSYYDSRNLPSFEAY